MPNIYVYCCISRYFIKKKYKDFRYNYNVSRSKFLFFLNVYFKYFKICYSIFSLFRFIYRLVDRI